MTTCSWCGCISIKGEGKGMHKSCERAMMDTLDENQIDGAGVEVTDCGFEDWPGQDDFDYPPDANGYDAESWEVTELKVKTPF